MAMLGLPLTLFGSFFGGFALLWMVVTSSASIGDDSLIWRFFPLFGLPFLLIGLAMFLAPLWGWMSARRTVYAISSDRAVIIQGRSVRSFESDEIEELERYERADGSGDVIFHTEHIASHGRRRRGKSVRRTGFPRYPRSPPCRGRTPAA